MGLVTIKVLEYETKIPISNLIIDWYSTEADNIPAKYKDRTNWTKLYESGWNDIRPTRIGSTILHQNGMGRFEIPANQKDRYLSGQNLWYTIKSPEIAGYSCGAVLHIACELLPINSIEEQILVLIPKSSLLRSSIISRAYLKFATNLETHEFHGSLKKIEKGIGNQNIRNSYAKRINSKLEEFNTSKKTKIEKRNLQENFSIPFKLRNLDSNKKDIPKIEFIKDKQSLHFIGDKKQIKLVYNGINYFTNKKLNGQELTRPYLEVNDETGRIKVMLTKVPGKLVASNSQSTSLFKFSNK